MTRQEKERAGSLSTRLDVHKSTNGVRKSRRHKAKSAGNAHKPKLANNPLFQAIHSKSAALAKPATGSPAGRGSQIRKPTSKRNDADGGAAGERPAPVQYSIKNLSLPTIAVLQNLDIGTTSEDIVAFLSSFGPITDCRSQAQKDGSVTAEVQFENSQNATRVLEKFDGSMADGRKIKVELTKFHRILRPADTWNGPKDNVRRPILRQ